MYNETVLTIKTESDAGIVKKQYETWCGSTRKIPRAHPMKINMYTYHLLFRLLN